MVNPSGKRRVIITNISPCVDAGRYLAKTVVHLATSISADIFADGHDKIAAAVLLRHSSWRQWQEKELSPSGNDHWQMSFIPDMPGSYYFQVIGWVNHFASWQEGIRKKYEAGQDISVDLMSGVQLATEASSRAIGKVKTLLQEWADNLKNVKNHPAGFALSQSTEVEALVNKYRDKNKVTVYPQIFELFAEPKKAMFSSWYELFPRSASKELGRHGTFSDVKQLLPNIARMGFDVLYLPPVHPIGRTHRKGRNNTLQAGEEDPGSPWAVGDHTGGHKAIHPQLGTIKDFRKLLEECQKYNIDVAMDIAFQCSPDHPYVRQHPQWFKWRADGTVQFAENPPKKYEDIIPFDFDCEDWMGLWMELKSVFQYWIDQGVSIFRVDNPHTKALPFWEWVIRELKTEYPQLIFLAEAFTRPRIMEHLAKIGFTQSYTYFTWRNTQSELKQYLGELTRTGLKDYFYPNFWPNTPDILPDVLVHGGEPAHIMRVILAGTLSSNYGIYGPVYEEGVNNPMPGKEEYNDNEKYEIKSWNWNRYTKIREVITRLNRIRKENEALQLTRNVVFAATDNEYILCFIKTDLRKENIIIVAVNLDPYNQQGATITLPLSHMGISPEENFLVHDLLSGEKYKWSGKNYVLLNPHDMPAHILRVVKN